jgi:PAS domain S-box-containing protein
VGRELFAEINAPESRQGNEGAYRDIFRASREALLVADGETGMLLDANPAAIALLGRSLEEIRTLHQSDVHEDHGAGRADFENRRHASGSMDHVLIRGDGTRVPVEISASPMRGPRGEKLVLGRHYGLRLQRHRHDEPVRTDYLLESRRGNHPGL